MLMDPLIFNLIPLLPIIASVYAYLKVSKITRKKLLILDLSSIIFLLFGYLMVSNTNAPAFIPLEFSILVLYPVSIINTIFKVRFTKKVSII